MKRLTSLLTLIIVVLVIAGGVYYFMKNGKIGNATVSGDFSKYSAVALTSNELFFGHIKSEDATHLVLEDVYFFTYVPDASASPTPTNNNNSSSDNQNLRPTLIDTAAKDSLAPTNTYVINRDQVKYSYPLKSDSQVVKTIEDYKNK